MQEVYVVQDRLTGRFYRTNKDGITAFQDYGTRVRMTMDVVRLWFRERYNDIILVKV